MKDRKVFSLQNFRGLDKENKPLKVAPFRASDGYNFIIDSDVLKTRPAFKVDSFANFFLNTDEYILNYYTFKNITLYVTNTRIQAGNSSYFSSSDFSGMMPFFVEEKEALFIFGLEDIYVVGVINNALVIYKLNNKPTNPYNINTQFAFYEQFENLPEPYVPTLFIGDNAFEDVNLLSNKTKYRIFAETSVNGFFVLDGNTTTYKLPTTYTYEKNGNYTELVTFYKNQYDDIEFFPFLIDVMYTEYEDSFTDFGPYINELDGSSNPIPIEIEETYYVKTDLEVKYDGSAYQDSITNIGLTKQEFFNLTIKDLDITVFEYCMERSRSITETENVTLIFEMNVDYNLIYRNQDGVFESSQRVSDTRQVLVGFIKYDTNTFDAVEIENKFNKLAFVTSGSQPAYPTLTETYDETYTETTLITLNNVSEADLKQIAYSKARAIVLDNAGDLTNGDKVRVNIPYRVNHYSNIFSLYSFSVGIEYESSGSLTKDNLYSIHYNGKENMFELSLRDFFIDFRNEPAIEVQITFENNPDYNLVSKNKFGVQFGSENRLFLAGHPDYLNIDRYNVSNDLLGNNVTSQSYELSYFPSKNYRVVGGKGAINGYVVATDTSLYISKEEYPNDSKLFIRTRNLDNNGVAGYFEYKTSVTKTPLNHRCFVRFYNDVLMLSKDGLYAVELSDNVLTNERLLKLRSGFINTDLKAAIASYDNSKIHIAENNYYMYIFIDKVVYVADSRYIDTNPNSRIDNVSYEIVKWNMNTSYRVAKLTETKAYLLDETYSQIYTLQFNESKDDNIERTTNVVSMVAQSGKSYFITPASYDTKIQSQPENIQFIFPSGKQYIATENIDYTRSGTTLTVLNDDAFRDITDGDTLYHFVGSFVVSGFEASGRTTMVIPNIPDMVNLAVSIANVPLYIVEIKGGEYYRLDRFKPSSIAITTTVSNVSTYEFTEIPNTCNINYTYPIQMMWLSNVTDFGNNLMEKTMFNANLYATKQAQENTLNFGYKTMRRLKELDDTSVIMLPQQIDLSNNFNFNELDFNIFAINTFQESGMSLPMKENNFLYIQFIIHGSGNIEFNGFHIIYKNNRNLKSIG